MHYALNHTFVHRRDRQHEASVAHGRSRIGLNPALRHSLGHYAAHGRSYTSLYGGHLAPYIGKSGGGIVAYLPEVVHERGYDALYFGRGIHALGDFAQIRIDSLSAVVNPVKPRANTRGLTQSLEQGQ